MRERLMLLLARLLLDAADRRVRRGYRLVREGRELRDRLEAIARKAAGVEAGK